MKSISSFWNSLTSSNRHSNSNNKRRESRYAPSYSSHPASTLRSSSDHIQGLAGNYSSYDLSSPYTPSFPGNPRRTDSTTKLSGTAHVSGPQHGVQLQEFEEDGSAPPPSVTDSWRRIDAWSETHYPELYDQLSYPATYDDLEELEAELEQGLPEDVKESLLIHDGQERGGRPTGLFFGLALLDCEELVDEWGLWKKVWQNLHAPASSDLGTGYQGSSLQYSKSGLSRTPSSIAPDGAVNGRGQSVNRPGNGLTRQVSKPENHIQTLYSHPSWIPLAKDYQGNNIAVDLSPGPAGRWGQVIVFGRDCDVKYVVAKSWSHFLAAFADDLESDKCVVEDDGMGHGDDGGVGGEMGRMRLVVDPERDYSYLETLKARIRKKERISRLATPRPNANGGGGGYLDRKGKGRAPDGRELSTYSPYASTATVNLMDGSTIHLVNESQTGLDPRIHKRESMSLADKLMGQASSNISSPRIEQSGEFGGNLYANGALGTDEEVVMHIGEKSPEQEKSQEQGDLAVPIDSSKNQIVTADNEEVQNKDVAGSTTPSEVSESMVAVGLEDENENKTEPKTSEHAQ